MFCPGCGTKNIENAQFCRGCGENISLVPQAMSGQVPETRAVVDDDVEDQPYDYSRRRMRRDRPPRVEKAIPNIFIGLAFLTISIILGFKGQDWWYWMLIPAFGLIGGGISEIVRHNQASAGKAGAKEPPNPKQAKATAIAPPPRVSALPPRDTSELVQPPSVTEGTTRHLNIKTEAPKPRVNKQAKNHGRET